MYILYEKMKQAQTNSVDLLDIIKQFRPLIIKYSRLLDIEFEDAVSELTAEFIRIVMQFPAYIEYHADKFILSYLKKSMHATIIAIRVKNATRSCPIPEIATQLIFKIICIESPTTLNIIYNTMYE